MGTSSSAQNLGYNCTNCVFDISLSQSPANVLIVSNPLYYVDEDPSYAFLEGVNVNDVKILKLADLKPMMSKKISLPTTFDDGIIELRGVTNGSGRYNFYNGYYGDPFSEAQFFYPERRVWWLLT